MKLEMMRSSKTTPQCKYVLEVCRTTVCLPAVSQGRESFGKNNLTFQKQEFFCFQMAASKFPYLLLLACVFSFSFLELISNFTPQDMSAELQKALSTKQNPNLVLKETKGSPVVFL